MPPHTSQRPRWSTRPRNASFIIAAVVVASVGYGWKKHLHTRQELLLAENARSKAELSPLSELTTQQLENQRLAVRKAEAVELEALRAEQRELERLRADVAKRRHQLANQPANSPTPMADAKVRAHVWRVGEELPATDWTAAGQATPDAALQTYLAAVAHNDAILMQRCLCFASNAILVTADHATKEVEYLRTFWQPDADARAKLVTLSQEDEQNAKATLELASKQQLLALVRSKQTAGGVFRIMDFSPTTATDANATQAKPFLGGSPRLSLRLVSGDWKVVCPNVPPTVTLVAANSQVLADLARELPQQAVDQFLKRLANRPGPLYVIWSTERD